MTENVRSDVDLVYEAPTKADAARYIEEIKRDSALALKNAINKAEREISEAIRVGCGRGEEYALAAHRTLTGTGAVTGYTAKPVVSPCGCIYKVCQDNAIFDNVYCRCTCHNGKVATSGRSS